MLKSELRAGARFAAIAASQLLSGIQAWPVWPNRARCALLRWWGAECAFGAEIGPGCFFSGPNLSLGECFVNREVQFDVNGEARIVIGDGCSIGPRTMLVTSHHEIGDASRRAGAASGRSIVIERGSWLGAGVLVLSGITIGAGCVVAAGAVVTRDCAPHGLYAGVPARRIRDLD